MKNVRKKAAPKSSLWDKWGTFAGGSYLKPQAQERGRRRREMRKGRTRGQGIGEAR